jgi:hypothetical protein
MFQADRSPLFSGASFEKFFSEQAKVERHPERVFVRIGCIGDQESVVVVGTR